MSVAYLFLHYEKWEIGGHANSVTDLFSSTLTSTIPPRSWCIIITLQVNELLLYSRANCSILNGSEPNLCSFLNLPTVFEDSELSFRKFQTCFCVSWNPNRSAVYLQASDLRGALIFFIKLVHFVGDDEAYKLATLLRNRVLPDNTPTYVECYLFRKLNGCYMDSFLFSSKILTYSLTPCNIVLLEKLNGSQLVKKFPAFYGTRKFITALMSPTTCPYPGPAQSSPYSHIPLREIRLSIILPSTSGSPKWSVSLRFPHQNPIYTSPLPHTRYMTANLILLDFITRSPAQYKLKLRTNVAHKISAVFPVIWTLHYPFTVVKTVRLQLPSVTSYQNLLPNHVEFGQVSLQPIL